jgi:hypothetical protein
MIGHKLPNKTKSATVAEPKLFHQLNNPLVYKAPFGYHVLKFNSHHINIAVNAWSTKCRLIACMSTQIMSNLRDESIKPN